MVRGNVTCLDMKLTKLNDKETLTEKDQQIVSKMVKKLEDLSAEFKTYMCHCAIVDHIENQDRLTKEQAVLDDHEDEVKDLMERLEDLVETTEPVMPRASGMGNHRPVVGPITEVEKLR